MGEAQEVQLHIMDQEAKDQINLPQYTSITDQCSTAPQTRNYRRWIGIAICTVLLLVGQSVAMLLGRLYFVKGGNSKWMATLVQLAGFPVLIPFYLISTTSKPSTNDSQIKSPSVTTLLLIYVSIGLLVAAGCYLYTIGLQYLPVSTYTLICASQLAFNSVFSFLLNAQKFTPFIINSLVLLTISSILLVFNNESSDGTSGVSKAKYAIGFTCTVAASAGYGLVLSLTQLCFNKVIKRQTFKVVLDMIIYQQIVATSVIVVGLFASGDWKGLTREMDGYKMGKVSYVMNLVGTAISWQFFAIGCVGLIFHVSSLFSNAISVLGLPIVPVLAVFVFNDKMGGVKAISMVLAIWGFISYAYHHYLDDRNCKDEKRNADEVSKALMLES
ncbi:PREDICTED: probable purine permease 10 [Populus euphratica]|uniref:Probable purine permease n=1 Tax=Populus euphratica TaxID=75702 RepID=A0AAJ6TA36_POPEU|nr:PREDICTED: probable purine permease 10 [Populus euphratica]XP_011007508.1 PREDICTED: probable purine permease 10 [Populus euphratica]XP_011007509.1 PREDICTED: probable purine permease 10 [Populus euphratica]